MRTMGIAGIMIVLVTGCKSEWDKAQEIIAENRDMAEARLAAFEKIGRSAADRELSSDELGEIEAKGLKLDFTTGSGCNATMALADDLVDLNKQAEPKIRFTNEDMDLTLTIADFLRKRGRSTSGDLRFNKHVVTTTFERFQRVKYLLVVRIGAYWEATPNPDNTFYQGKVSGEALLYRVDGSEFLGAFAYEAVSSDDVNLSELDPDRDSEILQEDLAKNMGDAIVTELQEHVPGSKPPGTFGL